MSNNEFKIATLPEIAKALPKFDNFYLTGHINPDGDSKGSVDCLKLALIKMGKNVQTEKCTFDKYCFIQMDVQPEYRLPQNVDNIKEKAEFTICIDHHQAEEPNCNLVFVDSKAAANALNVWDLVKCLNIEIDCDIASAAYLGLCSDTNSFMNTNTDKRCFIEANNMLEYGVQPAEIVKELFQSKSLASFQLQKICLENMYVDENNRFVLSFLRASDYKKFKATKDDSDSCIDFLRTLKCVDVACILRQESEGAKIRGSLRSKTDVDVSLLAKKHLGGGHKAAAGLIMDICDIDKAVDIIKGQLQDLMNGSI